MSDIIVRLDTSKNKPVAFVADSIDKGQLLTWQGRGEPEIVGVDYYHSTKPISKDAAKAMAEKYAKQFADDAVTLRERLPRFYMSVGGKYKTEGNKISTGSKKTAEKLSVVPATKGAVKGRTKRASHIDDIARQIATLIHKAANS